MYIHLKDIINRHGYIPQGIIHLGAHLGEEAKDYYEAGVKQVLWVEGNPSLFEELQQNISQYPGNKAINVLISDKDDTDVIFNITEFSQSSSILDLGITREIHQTNIVDRVALKAHRVDTIFERENFSINDYNLVNIDLQGYELVALKSMGKLLDGIDWVYTEVNVKPLYKNCALLYQIDLFLLDKGFTRVQTYMTPHFWGDALYKRTGPAGFRKPVRKMGIYAEEAGRKATQWTRSFIYYSYKTARSILKKLLFKK